MPTDEVNGYDVYENEVIVATDTDEESTQEDDES